MEYPQFAYGAGVLYVVPEDGSTPLSFASLQGVQIDFEFQLKELWGDGKIFPITIARGRGSITGKADVGQFSARSFNQVFFDDGVLDGSQVVTINERQVVAGGAVTVDSAATFAQDLGASRLDTGETLVRVGAGPNASAYAVDEATGVYTFNAALNGVTVTISYQYALATGYEIAMRNKIAPTPVTFKLLLVAQYQQQQMAVVLNRCTSVKLGLSYKTNDFTLPNFTFTAWADDLGEVGQIIVGSFLVPSEYVMLHFEGLNDVPATTGDTATRDDYGHTVQLSEGAQLSTAHAVAGSSSLDLTSATNLALVFGQVMLLMRDWTIECFVMWEAEPPDAGLIFEIVNPNEMGLRLFIAHEVGSAVCRLALDLSLDGRTLDQGGFHSNPFTMPVAGSWTHLALVYDRADQAYYAYWGGVPVLDAAHHYYAFDGNAHTVDHAPMGEVSRVNSWTITDHKERFYRLGNEYAYPAARLDAIGEATV